VPALLKRPIDALQYQFLRWWGRPDTDDGACTAVAYAGRSKLEALFGADFWPIIQGRTVLDFGCGTGSEVIELATHGAHRVVGLDIRPSALAASARAAAAAGVADRCVFTTQVEEPVDVVVSVDTFEHVADPAGALQTMHRLLGADGRVFLAFGPPWRHPYGGHLFSVFPWAHLLFSERALIRWRGDFKTDGATHFDEVDGGLNQMTVSRFARLIADSGFHVKRYETVPIRQLRWLARMTHGQLVREYTTSIVRCILNPGSSRP
jgi:SAM-dependent methyltransferase